MSLAVAKRAIDRALELESPPTILFHGSEPLFNSALIKAAVTYGERAATKAGKELSFSLQTNLTKMTGSFLNFVMRHGVGISTSLDGLAIEHNRNRPYLAGRATYGDVRRNVRRLLTVQNGLCVVCVITKYNCSHLDRALAEFEDMGITDVQFLPAVRCPGGKEMRALPSQILHAYESLFDALIRRWEEGTPRIHIRNLSQYLSSLFLRSAVDACRICSSTDYHPILAVDIDGTVYPCDFFWGYKHWSLGNVLDTPMKAMLSHPCNPRSSAIELTPCWSCDFRHICGGGCLADRLFSGTVPFYCETHKGVYAYLISRLPRLIKSGVLKRIMERGFPEYTSCCGPKARSDGAGEENKSSDSLRNQRRSAS